MRLLALLFPLLAACTLTLEALPFRLFGLRTQATYCAQGETQLDYGLFLQGLVEGLWFYWVPDGVHPSRASPEETLFLRGPFWGPEVRGFLTVTPEGRVQGGAATSPQGIGVEPVLPYRRLWVQGVADGVLGPYVASAQRVAPDPSPSCDPSW